MTYKPAAIIFASVGVVSALLFFVYTNNEQNLTDTNETTPTQLASNDTDQNNLDARTNPLPLNDSSNVVCQIFYSNEGEGWAWSYDGVAGPYIYKQKDQAEADCREAAVALANGVAQDQIVYRRSFSFIDLEKREAPGEHTQLLDAVVGSDFEGCPEHSPVLIRLSRTDSYELYAGCTGENPMFYTHRLFKLDRLSGQMKNINNTAYHEGYNGSVISPDKLKIVTIVDDISLALFSPDSESLEIITTLEEKNKKFTNSCEQFCEHALSWQDANTVLVRVYEFDSCVSDDATQQLSCIPLYTDRWQDMKLDISTGKLVPVE